ncbi:ABC-type multidrug/protein/lipid transport system ATPase component [Mycoplasmopsis caviae]|nr:ABC-type multidrug/protein/lipid transport system ATPase component [Mycoplasmopsis caviae]
MNHLSKLTNSDYLKRLGYIKEICEFQSNFTFTFLSEIFSLVGSMILLIWINYILFLVMFGVTIVVLLGNIIYHFWIEKNYSEFLEKGLENMKGDIDFIYSWKEMGNVDFCSYIEKNQNKRMYEFKKKEYSFNSRGDLKNFWNDLFIGNFSTIIVFISSFFILKNQLSVGSLMMFLNGINFFINPMLNLSSLMLNYSMIKRNTNLVNFVLNLEEKNNLNDGLLLDKIKKIELENINFFYENGKPILNIPTFVIDKNIQINGKNGSGKTTFLNFINNCFKGYLGKIKVNDFDIDTINLKNYQSKNILINSSSYFPDVSIIEYITSGNNEYKNELNVNIQKYNLQNIFSEMNFNINGQIISNGSNLSSGQKQLMLLLKLFTRKYDLVMLDEAFENINLNISSLLKKAIKKYQNDSIFIEISHNKNYVYNNKEVYFEKINNCF